MDIGVAFSAFKNILSHKKFAGVIKPVTTQTFVKVSLFHVKCLYIKFFSFCFVESIAVFVLGYLAFDWYCLLCSRIASWLGKRIVYGR